MSNNSATIAFTLPVSCQICLGKVKQPVVCPNQHVFCGPCMELWLERNQQCPACRVYITEQNPCKQVLGGLNPETAPSENFCQKELRRARMELIYKDYENELDRIEAELEATKQDNKELRVHLRSSQDSGNPGNKVTKSPVSPKSPLTSEQDRSTISLLNNKLKDAASLYDKVKAELAKYKQENAKLRDQTANQLRENQTLRLDLSGRSPRRFGRHTVATLEAKVETSEKQIEKLQKALERSDGYIEDIERQLEKQRTNHTCVKCAGKVKGDKVMDGDLDLKMRGHKMDNDLDLSRTDSNWNDSELPSRISNISDAVSDVVSDVRLDDSDVSLRVGTSHPHTRSSFNLEIPSPMSKSSKQYNDTDITEDSRTQATDDSFQLSKPSTSDIPEPTLDGCKKKLRFTFGDDDSSSNDIVGGMHVHRGDSSATKAKVRFSMDVLDKEPPAVAEDMNVSITPDLEDCFRIMDEAKRKLDQRQQPTVPGFPGVGNHLGGASATGVSSMHHTLFPKNTHGFVNVPAVAATSSNTQMANGHASFAKSLPLTGMTSSQYPRMHNLAESLNLGNGFSQPSRSHGTHINQSTAMSQTPLMQKSQSNDMSHMNNLSVPLSQQHPKYYNSSESTLTSNPHSSMVSSNPHHIMAPVPGIQTQPYSISGSALSQPAPSLHHNLGMFNSATLGSSTVPTIGFPNFTISQ